MSRTQVTIGNLPDGPTDALLYCRTCGMEASADLRDYWYVPPDHVFKCCGRNMSLMRKVVLIRLCALVPKV